MLWFSASGYLLCGDSGRLKADFSSTGIWEDAWFTSSSCSHPFLSKSCKTEKCGSSMLLFWNGILPDADGSGISLPECDFFILICLIVYHFNPRKGGGGSKNSSYTRLIVGKRSKKKSEVFHRSISLEKCPLSVCCFKLLFSTTRFLCNITLKLGIPSLMTSGVDNPRARCNPRQSHMIV